MLTLEAIHYHYLLRNREIPVLNNCTYTFEQGSLTAIQAPSGSGKTTLLNILGLMDETQRGAYRVLGQDTSCMTDTERSLLRAQSFGFLFQNFRLIPSLTVLENVALTLEILGMPKAKRQSTALNALEKVGLETRAEHLPPELSGGEAQRVALARALVKSPEVLLADEPTGNLDAENRDRVLNLIAEFHKNGGTVVMVTHDATAALRANKILTLRDGQLFSDT
jgi:putative ABC transport system ATP-binding protein